MLLGYPDSRPAFEAKFPGFVDGCEPFVRFVTKLSQFHCREAHQEAVVNQCVVAWDIYVAVVVLVSNGFPVPAMVLCRNLFEVTIGTLYLTDNPPKLSDFLDHGKLLPLELMANSPHASPAIKSQYRKLKARFGMFGWYGMKISALAEIVGFGELYNTFYKEACSIAHAGSFVSLIPRYGVGCRQLGDLGDGRDYAKLALGSASLIIYLLFQKVDTTFNLRADNDILQFESYLRRTGFLS